MSLSVVIPARDAAAWIGEALASIAAQEPPPDEVILVDDGSSDDTAGVARRACADLRVVSQAHAGAAAALNRGIRASRSPLVAFLDADDRWEKGKLTLQLAALARRSDAAGVLGRVEQFLCPSLGAEAASRYQLPEAPQAAWCTGALLARREAFEMVGGFAEELVAGFAIDWFDRARAAGLRFEIPEQTVLHRRIRPGSLSHRTPGRDHAFLEVAKRALVRRRVAPPDISGQ
jgi:glycosyltransferase involved in cell wall biosynthesis